MTWLLALAAASGWTLVAILFVLLPRMGRRRLKKTSLKVRSHVEPYLQRRAAEVGLSPAPVPSEPTDEPAEIIATSCDLADRLTANARAQIELGDTLNIAVSDTMPLPTTDPE